MTRGIKQSLVGLAAAAAVGICIMQASLAQTGGAGATPGDGELNAVIQQAADGPQGKVPEFTDLFPSSTSAASAPRPTPDERGRLLDAAAQLIQAVGNEQQTKQAVSRLETIVERLRQLETRDPIDPLATNRQRNADPPLLDPQRLEELRKLLLQLQNAQTQEARAAAAQKLQQLVQNVKVLLATRAEQEGLQQNPIAQPRPTTLLGRRGGPTATFPGGPNPFTAQIDNGQANVTFFRSGVPPTGGEPQWQQIASGFENEIRQASERMRNATDDSKKADAKQQLGNLLNQYFDQDTLRREQELASIEERVKNLRAQLAKRKEKKQEIIDLQMKVAENEADGLGFFSTQGPEQNVNFLYVNPATAAPMVAPGLAPRFAPEKVPVLAAPSGTAAPPRPGNIYFESPVPPPIGNAPTDDKRAP